MTREHDDSTPLSSCVDNLNIVNSDVVPVNVDFTKKDVSSPCLVSEATDSSLLCSSTDNSYLSSTEWTGDCDSSAARHCVHMYPGHQKNKQILEVKDILKESNDIISQSVLNGHPWGMKLNSLLNPIQTGLFFDLLDFWTSNSENIKATAVKL